MALVESRQDLLKQAGLELPPFLKPQQKKKLFKKYQQKLYLAIQNNDVNPQVLIEFNQEFRHTVGHALWGREEALLPLINVENIEAQLFSLKEHEKLHYEVKSNVFRKLKIRKSLDEVSIGERSIEAVNAVFDLLNKSIAEGNPNVKLYLTLTQNTWFKTYTKSQVEQASIVGLSTSLLIKKLQIIQKEIVQSPQAIQRSFEDLWILLNSFFIQQIIKINTKIRKEILAILSFISRTNSHKLFLDKIRSQLASIQSQPSNPELEQLIKDYTATGNLDIFMEATESYVLVFDKKGKLHFNTSLNYSALERRKLSQDLYDVNGQRIAYVVNGDYLPVESSRKKYIITKGPRVIILNAVGNFQVVKASQATLPEKNAAFQLIINHFEIPDYSNEEAYEEHIDKILQKYAYILNGQHMLDYLASLSVSLSQIKKTKSLFQFEVAELAIENLERFLAAIPFHHMTHQGRLKKSLLDVFEQFEEVSFLFYLIDCENENFIERSIAKVNNKGTFDEQLRLLERWLKLAFKVGANSKIFPNILLLFEKLNFSKEVYTVLNKRSPKFCLLLSNLKHKQGESRFIIKPRLHTPYNILTKLSTETGFQRFRRRHHKAIGLSIGLPLGTGGVILLTLSAIVLLNPLFGTILITATFIINMITHPQVVSALFKEGIFTLNDHTIKQKKYKIALVASLTSSTIYSFMLGVTVALALIGLSSATLGAFPALFISVGLGLLIWAGNTFLLADLFRQICVHLDKWGVSQACQNVITNLKDFFSFKDCRDWQDVLRKTVRVILQPLFILLAVSISLFASLELMKMLRLKFTEFLSMCKQCTDSVGKKLVEVLLAIGFFSQLPLSAKKRSTSIVFNKWAKWLANTMSNGFITLINNIKHFYHEPSTFFQHFKMGLFSLFHTAKSHIQLLLTSPGVYFKSVILAFCRALKKLPPALREASINRERHLIRHPPVKKNLSETSLYHLIAEEVKTKKKLALDPSLLASSKHSFFSNSQMLRRNSNPFGLSTSKNIHPIRRG